MRISNISVYLIILILAGCWAPTEQQANRQKLMEGLKDQKIKRVTEEKVYTAAYQEGSRIVESLRDKSRGNLLWSESKSGKEYTDSLNAALSHGGIRFFSLTTDQNELDTDQKALWEAYQYSTEQDQPIVENVQTSSDDYLLYTYPEVKQGEFSGMWSILLSRKTLVRNL
jgi:hypothetical protein